MKYATKVDVLINEETGQIETTLHFNTEPNPYHSTSMPFINELKKLLSVNNEYEIKRSEIASSIKNFSFATYKATNEENFVTYSFINGGKFKSFIQEGHEYLMTLAWDEYMRLPINLEEIYSKTSEKYKERKKKIL